MSRVCRKGAPIALVLADSAVQGEALRADVLIGPARRDAGLVVLARASQARPHFHGPTARAFQDAPRAEHAIALEKRLGGHSVPSACRRRLRARTVPGRRGRTRHREGGCSDLCDEHRRRPSRSRAGARAAGRAASTCSRAPISSSRPPTTSSRCSTSSATTRHRRLACQARVHAAAAAFAFGPPTEIGGRVAAVRYPATPASRIRSTLRRSHLADRWRRREPALSKMREDPVEDPLCNRSPLGLVEHLVKQARQRIHVLSVLPAASKNARAASSFAMRSPVPMTT